MPATSTGTTWRARRDSSIESGAHGIVWPQGSSSVANLTKDERMRGLEVLAKANQGRKAALVLGVQGRNTAEMLEYARRAEALAPDAMIAMPPSAATIAGRVSRVLPRAGAGDPAAGLRPDERRRERPAATGRSDRRARPRVSASRLRQGRIGAAHRADEGGGPAAPSAQGRVRRVVRRRLAVRDAARPRRRDDRAWRCMPI